MRNLDTIRQLEIFNGLSDKEMATVIRRSKQMEYKAEGVIVREKSPGGMMHIILEGSVEVRKKTPDGNEKPLAILNEGTVFGEMSFFDGCPYSASVIAKENTSTLTMFKNDFLEMAETEPALALKMAINLINTLSTRLRKTNENLVTFAALRGKE
ncbi:cyclic nucleotide-binding domain-containing protein [candidate division FCPU426 bacterium]|nr:cyclic nucleotide-binding domain-containing protein [candidate division FCPU426 bacterium]